MVHHGQSSAYQHSIFALLSSFDLIVLHVTSRQKPPMFILMSNLARDPLDPPIRALENMKICR